MPTAQLMPGKAVDNGNCGPPREADPMDRELKDSELLGSTTMATMLAPSGRTNIAIGR